MVLFVVVIFVASAEEMSVLVILLLEVARVDSVVAAAVVVDSVVSLDVRVAPVVSTTSSMLSVPVESLPSPISSLFIIRAGVLLQPCCLREYC